MQKFYPGVPAFSGLFVYFCDIYSLTPKQNEMNNRVLVGGLIGGVVFFLLGWIVYGIAVRDTLEANMMPGVSRSNEEMQLAFVVIGNMAFGFLLSYILDKANTLSFTSGASVGAVIGFLASFAGNMTNYGTSHVFTSLTGVFVDIVAFTVMCAIVGGIIGWWYGRSTRTVVVPA